MLDSKFMKSFQSDSIRLQIKAVEGVKLGGVLKVFNTLVKYKGKLAVKFEGSHKQLEKMLLRLKLHSKS